MEDKDDNKKEEGLLVKTSMYTASTPCGLSCGHNFSKRFFAVLLIEQRVLCLKNKTGCLSDISIKGCISASVCIICHSIKT